MGAAIHRLPGLIITRALADPWRSSGDASPGSGALASASNAIEELRERVATLQEPLDVLERRPVDNLTGIDGGLARIDRLADKLERTLQVSERRLDDRPLPLSPLSH
jgi:hypothetical protein